MKIWLAAVGRARAGAARDLYEEYARRMTWPLVLKEVESKKRVPPDELKRLEADLLLSAVPNAATIVALDDVELYSLTKDEFSAVLKQIETFEEEFRKIVFERQ